MPSLCRLLLVAAHAASMALLCAPPLLSVQTLARPLWHPPQPRGIEQVARAVRPKTPKAKPVGHNATHAAHPAVVYPSAAAIPTNSSAAPNIRDLNVNTVLQNINLLNTYYSGAQQNAEALNTYSTRASSYRTDPDFNQQSADELSAFQTNVLGFQTVLAQLGADKGLANYDKSNDLETLLKNMVNLNKDVLSYTTALVYVIPVLGPILGPIVYEIKCLLDEILDATENLTDGLLNALEPMLRPLIGDYLKAACASGIEVVGICL